MGETLRDDKLFGCEVKLKKKKNVIGGSYKGKQETLDQVQFRSNLVHSPIL